MSQLLDSLASKEGLEKSDVFERCLIDRAIEKGIPLSGHFELTPRCNLDCVMCYVHLTKDQMYKPELSTEEWISLVDQACDAGMMYAVLSGGECFLYQGFWEIFDRLQSRGVLVTVLTNGTLLDRDTIVRLAACKPKRIQVSVYGSSPTGYDKVTGSGEAFYKVDRAINLLIEAGLPVNFAVTVTKQIMPDMKDILRYCDSKKKGVTRMNASLFETRFDTGREFKNFAITADEQVELSEIRKEVFFEGCVQDTADKTKSNEVELDKQIVFPERGLACTAGRFGFAINWDGKMIPCSMLDYADRYPLIEGFQNSWKYINKKCREYTNPVECVDCLYNNVCRKCPADHYKKVGEGSVNPAFCAEMKRLAEEVV